MSEYILDNDNDKPESELTEIKTSEMTENEKEVLKKLEELSLLCSEKQIPCFLSAKFSTQSDPSAAWFFGQNPLEAHKNFITDFAPIMLHVTSKMTMTEIKAINPETGQEVYNVKPDRNVDISE